jgi:hypothetical protein
MRAEERALGDFIRLGVFATVIFQKAYSLSIILFAGERPPGQKRAWANSVGD